MQGGPLAESPGAALVALIAAWVGLADDRVKVVVERLTGALMAPANGSTASSPDRACGSAAPDEPASPHPDTEGVAASVGDSGVMSHTEARRGELPLIGSLGC